MKPVIFTFLLIVLISAYGYEHTSNSTPLELMVVHKEIVPPQHVSYGFGSAHVKTPFLITLSSAKNEIRVNKMVSRDIWHNLHLGHTVYAIVHRGRLSRRILKIEMITINKHQNSFIYDTEHQYHPRQQIRNDPAGFENQRIIRSGQGSPIF